MLRHDHGNTVAITAKVGTTRMSMSAAHPATPMGESDGSWSNIARNVDSEHLVASGMNAHMNFSPADIGTSHNLRLAATSSEVF